MSLWEFFFFLVIGFFGENGPVLGIEVWWVGLAVLSWGGGDIENTVDIGYKRYWDSVKSYRYGKFLSV